jgi:membrane protease YdiL (CAAX protease family)
MTVTSERTLTRREILGLATAFEGGMLVLALVVGWLLGRPPWGYLGPSISVLALGLVATIPLFALLAWSSRSQLSPLVRLRQEIDTVLVPAFGACTRLDLAAVSLLAGVGEEALFRGLIQPGIAEVTTPWIGLLSAGVLFGLAHLVTPTYAILAGIVGMYLGWLFISSENLLLPVTVHSVYDFAALTFLTRRQLGQEDGEGSARSPADD